MMKFSRSSAMPAGRNGRLSVGGRGSAETVSYRCKWRKGSGGLGWGSGLSKVAPAPVSDWGVVLYSAELYHCSK